MYVFFLIVLFLWQIDTYFFTYLLGWSDVSDATVIASLLIAFGSFLKSQQAVKIIKLACPK